MTFWQLFIRNLFFFWRTNLAVIAGVVAATAVIGGALVVGDSVRDSLKQMSLDRLGDVDFALTGPRFFREELAAELQNAVPETLVSPLLMMQGTVESSVDQQTVRAGHIQVYGVDERAWQLFDHGDIQSPGVGELVVNQRVAEQLQLQVGDEVSLIVEIPASIPRDALLGDREETVTELVVSVSGIAADAQGIARLGLNPTQQLPLNAFVSLADLQQQTGLAEIVASKRNPVAKPARVNTLFISTPSGISPTLAEQLTSDLHSQLTLEDLALKLLPYSEHSYLSLESEQMIIEKSLAGTALDTAEQMQLTTSPVLVYLINEIYKPGQAAAHSMYSIIAGVDMQDTSPFGPFTFQGEHRPLQGDRVYINSWLAEDVQAELGDELLIKYHEVGDRGELPEETHPLEVAGIVELTGPADDRNFTPNVPGVTDAESYDDWREPFPLKKDEITPRDDEYWEDYRTTPKLFLSLVAAQDLWRSKYGELTSIRIAADAQNIEETQQQFGEQFLKRLQPQQTGLIVQPVKATGLAAAQGTNDFSSLFIGFSFFLILSATILVGLLFRLGVEQRVGELGLLSAIGLAPAKVRQLLFGEGVLLVIIGGVLGVLGAIGYAGLMIYGLKTWWFGAIGTKFLFLSVHPLSLCIGFTIAAIVAIIAIYWALRQTRGHSTRELLSGELAEGGEGRASSGRWSWRIATGLLFGACVLLAATLLGVIPEVEAFSGFSWKVVSFFLVGTGLLVGSLTLLAAYLTSQTTLIIDGAEATANARLGLRNAARNRSRSVLTTSLIASATFVIVAVAAGQQDPTATAPRNDSANGGFTLVAETNVPILNDLNTEEGRAKLGFSLLDSEENSLLNQISVAPFRVRRGENASCLNLYQTQLPTILGVPHDVLEEFISKNRFTFADTPGEQPWALIEESLESGNIPVLGDMNTLMYSLHKGIGATIPVSTPDQPDEQLEVRGMFNNSIFQGVLVMSEANFARLFPEQVGFQYFLIEVAPPRARDVSNALEAQLGDYGFDAERVSDRLADFLAVQNTYLSTFQTLGGLGLLLGTIGLATVMLRNVLERRGELALLRAVGFRRRQVGLLVLWENAFLLGWGLVVGTVSALLAMSPHLLSTGSNLPWRSLAMLLGTVFLFGMCSALLALRAAVNTPILSTLRGE